MVTNTYANAETLSERIKIAKQTSIEQRTGFLENHSPPIFKNNDAFVDLLAELIKKDYKIPVTVLVCDIRKSTIIMQNSIDLGIYGGIMTSFVEQSKDIVTEEHNGWFDTFTGDGFACFWLPEIIADFQLTDAGEIDDINLSGYTPKFKGQLLSALHDIFQLYLENIHQFFRQNTKTLPIGTGLGFGIDNGKGVFVPTPSGSRISVVGDPYVGAARLESLAPPYTAAIKHRLGEKLWNNREEFEMKTSFTIQRAIAETQEYPEGMHIYILKDKRIEDLLENETAEPVKRAREQFIDRKNLIIGD